MKAQSHQSPWLATALIAMIGVWLLEFQAPLRDIARLALGDIERSYILLAPLVSIYLVVLRRSRWRRLLIRRTWVGPFIVLAGVLLSSYGLDRDHIVLWHGGAVLAFVGIIVSFLGLNVLVAFGPAIIALGFVIPVPGVVRQAIAQPLQNMATQMTAFFLDLLGVDVTQAGNLLQINGAMVAIGEACDGMRLLLPLSLIIFAFVYSLPLRSLTRCCLLLVSVPIAIACNVLRLVPTAIAYGFLPDHARSIHDLGGWLMIPVAIWMLLFVIRLAEWLDLPVGRWLLVGA